MEGKDSSSTTGRADLKQEQVRELYTALQKILQKAILLRGSSISDFLDAEGLPGEYQQHHRAYGREGKPCFRCKTPIRRVIVAGSQQLFLSRIARGRRGGETQRGGLKRRARESKAINDKIMPVQRGRETKCERWCSE